MKFLLDANLSPLIADHFRQAGHSARHVRDVGLRHASDEQIMDFADQQSFVIISQDTDFTNLLYYRKTEGPSVILLRDLPEVSANQIAALILDNLGRIDEALRKGAVVSMADDRIRVRRLPLG